MLLNNSMESRVQRDAVVRYLDQTKHMLCGNGMLKTECAESYGHDTGLERRSFKSVCRATLTGNH
jgi:hypothetical protein